MIKFNGEDGDVLKRAFHKGLYSLYKAFEMDMEQFDSVPIVKRGFEISTEDKKYQVILEVREVN